MELELRKLARVITKGTTPNTAGYAFVESGVPFLRAEDIAGATVDTAAVSKRISQECHEAFRRSKIESGDVLVTIAGTIGRVAVMPESTNTANCNQAVAIVKLKQDLVEPAYILYALRSPKVQAQLRQQGTTATIMNVSLSQIGDLLVPCPPKEEQRRVVDLLSRAENVVRMRREAEQKAKEIIPALFLDMFGDPGTNPMGWAYRRFGDMVQRFEGGKNIQAGAASDSPFRILKISAVTSGEYDESESKPAPAGFEPPAHYLVRKGDFLFSRANTEALVGATAVVSCTDGRSLLPDKLWRMVWKSGETIYSPYMLALLQNRSMRAALSKIASGTGGSMKNISQGKLAELKLPIASEVRQQEFDERVSRFKKVLAGSIQADGLAGQLFSRLLADAFRL